MFNKKRSVEKMVDEVTENIKPPKIGKTYLLSLSVNDGSAAVNVVVKAENIIGALDKYFSRSTDCTGWEALSLDVEEIQILE